MTSDADFDDAGLVIAKAEIAKNLGNADEAKRNFLEASELLRKNAEQSSLKFSKGSNLRRGYVLLEAGQNAEAEKLYKEMAQSYGDEFTFNYNYARVLNLLGKPLEALPFAEKAHALSYGTNWLRAVHLEAKILVALKKQDQARTLIDQTLAQVKLPKSTEIWDHYRVKELRAFRIDLN